MRQHLRSRANAGRISVALALSYVFDWVIIIAAAAVGAVFSLITPNKRPFALVDRSIMFPHKVHETVSTPVLAVVGLVAPAAIIFVMCLLLVPGPTVPKSTPKSLIWQRKFWEWHTGWLGLAMSLAASFIVTQGMKILFGKPRPDLLSRCIPDIANAEDHIIGGFANVAQGFNLYSATICTQTDKSILNDGFMSFPSGHSSFSSAGLVYLSLFIASKLAITVPFLPQSSYTSDEPRFAAFPSRARGKNKTEASGGENASVETTGYDNTFVAARNQAAAPPVYLLIFAIIPFFGSVYISASRFSDFRHHGFDILFGYTIGLISAIFAFRYYHLPISQGAGWSWGPRSSDRSFWAGVGVGNYVGRKDTEREREPIPMTDMDLEHGQRPLSNDVGSGAHSRQATMF